MWRKFIQSFRPRTAWQLAVEVATVGAFAVAIYAFFQPGTVTNYFEKFDDRTASIDESVDRIADTTSELVEVTRALPDAVSSDPVKELVNRGYALDTSAFKRAIQAEDAISVGLFCNAAKDNWWGHGNILFDLTYYGPTYNQLLKCRAFDRAEFCNISDINYFNEEPNGDKKRKVYLDFCGENALELIDARNTEQVAALKVNEQRVVRACTERAEALRILIHKEQIASNVIWRWDSFVRSMDYTDEYPSTQQCKDAGISIATVWEKETANYN